MPVPLLIAMILAFGLRLPTEAAPLARPEVIRRLAESGGGVLVLGALGWICARLVVARVRRFGPGDRRARRIWRVASQGTVGLGLLVFAAQLILIDWTRVVRWGLGLRAVPVVQELAILAPYLLGQLAALVGLAPGEIALRPRDVRWRDESWRRMRRSAALALPVAVVYLLGRYPLHLLDPTGEDPISALMTLGICVLIVFFLSPFIIRLAWPTSSMPRDELRERLERLSARLGFRPADILVWDLGPGVINAGVVGALPRFRYVLITRAMIEVLDAREIESVFAHELGHVAHRHLPYFAAFSLVSVTALMAVSEAAERLWGLEAGLVRLVTDPVVGDVLNAVVVLAILAAFFFLVFGAISRRFERQADLYGTLAISCDRADCPPHADPDEAGAAGSPPDRPCAEGVRIFAGALTDVTVLNGMTPEAGSWRHGTVAARIAFLERMAADPAALRRFRRGTSLVRWGLMLGLAAVSAAGWAYVAGASR